MSEPSLAPIRTWLTAPMKHDVSEAIERLRRAPDVQQIAVMPDVHLATDVCIGVVVATSRLIYPQAVGGDIGCGMLAVGFDVEATALQDPGIAGRVLAGLGRAVPARRRNRRAAIAPPPDLEPATLSHPSLEAMRRNEGVIEFATLGSGNHFIELQSDEDGRLWLMVHSGSRGMGPAIRDHHLGHGEDVGGGLRALDATSDEGASVSARRRLGATLRGRKPEGDGRGSGHRALRRSCVRASAGRPSSRRTTTTCRSNVTESAISGSIARVRCPPGSARVGFCPARWAVSASTWKAVVTSAALCSSAHGAGRALSRTAGSRAKVTERELRRQMEGVWYDYRLANRLRDEAPAAYKDIRAVLRAQKELVKVTRMLRPVLNYKGV